MIEGAGKQLATQRGLTAGDGQAIFAALAEDCKQEFVSRNMRALDEIESMMDSFVFFMKNYMYVNSSLYPLVDKTNRHGITHGAYTDADYGRPLNFYKTIAAIDFLAFVSDPVTTLAEQGVDKGLQLSMDPARASRALSNYHIDPESRLIGPSSVDREKRKI